MDDILLQMQSIVEKNVKHWKSDFYDYDVNTYGRMYPDVNFIYLVRDCGTYILGIPSTIKDEKRRNDTRITSLSILEYYIHHHNDISLFDVVKNKSLKKITYEKALEKIKA